MTSPGEPSGDRCWDGVVESTVAHEARMYDYLLGGDVNFEVDYNNAYYDYLVTTGIQVVRRRDPTFGLLAADLITALERRMRNNPSADTRTTEALLSDLAATVQ